MRSIIFLLPFVFFTSILSAQNSTKIEIRLKEGDLLKADFARFSNGELFGSPFITTDPLGLDRIYADKINYVNAISPSGNELRFEVIHWRFLDVWVRVDKISDRITTFDNSVMNQFYMDPITYSGFTDLNIIAYRKDNGEAKRITVRNLRKDLSDKYESKLYLNKARNQTIIQVVSTLAGVAFVGLGVRETFMQATGESPLSITKIGGFYLLGTAGFVVPVVIKPFKRHNMFRALRAY